LKKNSSFFIEVGGIRTHHGRPMAISSFSFLGLLLVVLKVAHASPDTTRFRNPNDCQCRSDGSVFCAAGSCVCLRDNDETCASVCTPTTDGSPSFSCSAGNDCCDTRRRRRKLQGADFAVDLDGNQDHQELNRATLDRCGNLTYDGYLFVTSHFYAVAVPQRQAEEANCPFLVSHSYFDSEQAKPEKQLLYWETKEEGESRFADGALYQKSIPIGSFHLDQLARAHQEVQLNLELSYDLFRNNCANYVIGLAHELQVKIDAHVTTFVARRLVEESGSQWVDSIRNNMLVQWSLQSFWEWLYQWFLGMDSDADSSNVSEEQTVVQQLVEAQASELMDL